MISSSVSSLMTLFRMPILFPFFGGAKAMILMMTKLAKIGTQKVVMTLQNRLALSL
jgi:hypothetical protein